MSKYYDKKQLPKEPIHIITEGYGGVHYKNIIIMFILFIILTMLITTILNKFYPQPTFREVCEANNGTYIDNNGRAGDNCIYNR